MATIASHDFHAHHSPLGAYATFTCGRHFAGGGMATCSGQAPTQNLVIGYVDERGVTHALPFFTTAQIDLEAFVAGMSGDGVRRLAMQEGLERHYGAGVDRWTHGDFSFSVFTPVWDLPDPAQAEEALQDRILPVVSCRLTLDNSRHDSDRTLLFHLEDTGAPKVVSEQLAGGVGVSFGRNTAIAAPADSGAKAYMHWNERDWLHEDRCHLLGATGGLTLTVPAGERRELDLVIAFYDPGLVTTGVEGSFYYTRRWASLVAVAEAGLRQLGAWRERAETMDVELAGSGLSDDEQFLIAHAQRSYWGNTQLLDVGGQPRWVVLEGEYCMINTFDLSVDQLFYELRRNPWVVRNLLEQFIERYSYVDGLNRPPTGVSAEDRPTHCRDPHMLGELVPPPAEEHLPGGISFCHDMGVHGHFSPPSHSSYECSHLIGCFSYMTCEQLLNWICVATSYVQQSGDLAWLQHRRYIVEACLDSLLNRDDPVPSQRDGINGLDSDRCAGGWEITTYDSLDPSLGQARHNLYMAVKGWASWLGLELLLQKLGNPRASEARSGADKAAASIAKEWNDDLGFIPAVFHSPNRSAIIPAVEGLAFPLVWGLDEFVSSDGPYASLIAVLGKHLEAILKPGVCLFADGGWKLSSTADNSWMSKIFIGQHVAKRVYGIDAAAEAHAAHVAWQTDGSRDYAFSDQCVNGVGKGSRYYPRGVTNDLWLW